MRWVDLSPLPFLLRVFSPSFQFYLLIIKYVLDNQRFHVVDTDGLPFYADYEAIPDKHIPEAQALLGKVEVLYYHLAHDLQNAQYMDNDLFEDIFKDVYEEYISNRLIDSGTDPTVMNSYFDALEQAFRDKDTSLLDHPRGY